MNRDSKSIIYSTFFPILLLTLSITFITFTITNKITSIIEEENIRLLKERHIFEIRKIIDRALTEITTTQMLKYDIPMLIEVKQNDVMGDIKTYWEKNNLQGAIIVNDNEIKLSTLHSLTIEILNDISDKEGHKVINDDFFMIIKFPAWEWTILTTTKLSAISKTKKLVNYIIPINLLGGVITLSVYWLFLHLKVSKPMKGIVNDIRENKTVRNTNISEIDVLVDTINKSVNDLNIKNQNTKMLHDTVIELQKYSSIQEIFEKTITIAKEMFHVDSCAIIYSNMSGKISNFVMRGDTIELRECIFYLQEYIPVCVKPITLNTREELYQLLDDGKVIKDINNLSAYPHKIKSTKESIVFYFINKEGGFSDYDISLINIFTSDVVLVLETAFNMAKLQRFQKVIDSSFDSIIITNSKAEITYVNPTFEKVTGYKKEEVIGKNPRILKSNYQNEAFYRELWQSLKQNSVWKGEFVNKKKNGDLYNESAVIFPIYFEDELNYVAIKRDITQEKKLYEQLIRAQKMEAIGTLAGGIAHDFNNILTAILGYSELLISSMDSNDKYFKYVRIINESAKKAAELTKKILSITRKEKLEAKAIQINDIIRDVIDLVSHSIPKNIEIVSHLSGDIPITYADPTQMHQVILNLAVNARDAMPDGGTLTISTSLVGSSNVSTSDLQNPNGKFIKISVSDTGVGMDEDIQQKVFDPFFTTKEKNKGSGLGLFIVHYIITNHNGYINLYSEPNRGTRFNIYIPITKINQDTEEQNNDNLEGAGTILIIDDEEHVRSVCGDVLNALGFDVIYAIDGKDGIQKYIDNKDKIKAVILDMIMPRMGGNEVFSILKELNPSVKIIISSGFSQEGYAGIDKLIKEGAVGFIQKPFTLNTLKKMLKHI